MKGLAFSLLALLLVSCGQSPLLKIAGANFAPVTLGTSWLFVTPALAPAFEKRVVSAGIFAGKAAFQVDTLVAGLTLTAQESYSGSAIERYNGTFGAWETVRKVPYVTGNRWDLFMTATVSTRVYVEGIENLVLPAGTFVRCFKIRSEQKTYNPGTGVTTTAESLAWSAPGVGDVQYGSLANSVITVTSVLASYSPGP